MTDPRTMSLTLLALVAFASNSLLTRLALGAGQIDAASFTSIRLASGAVVLAFIVRRQAGTWNPLRGFSAGGPIALFAYALPFSLAYLRIGAALGALVLFGSVQVTMIGYGILRGERPPAATWVGFALAGGGLVALMLPSAGSSGDAIGLALMVVAGAAWGAYSLIGRRTAQPLAANARSFIWATGLALATSLALVQGTALSPRGVCLALISGALTSGLGYAVWYAALPYLTVTQAAVAQLSVPVIAAVGATVLLDETLGGRLVICGIAVLGGVGLALTGRGAIPAKAETVGRDST